MCGVCFVFSCSTFRSNRFELNKTKFIELFTNYYECPTRLCTHTEHTRGYPIIRIMIFGSHMSERNTPHYID